jgi:hypothetical protein
MPTVGRPRDPRKEQFWRQTLLRFERSRLTPTQFCRLHKLKLASFWAWQRNLRLRDCNSRQTQLHPRSTADSPKPDPLPVFLPVALPLPTAANATPTAEPLVEILWPNGLRLRLPQHFDPKAVQQLLALLRGGASC